MVSIDTCSSASFAVTARPNCSLSGKGKLVFLAAVVSVIFGIAGGFAWAGAWLVVPFAGLEVLLIGWVVYVIHRSAGDYESISVSDGRLRIERFQRKRVVCSEFQSYWTQVILHSPVKGGGCRLFVRSSGRQIEVGRFMDDAERLMLARHLQERTGSYNRF